MRLSELNNGESAVIGRIYTPHSFAVRLADMGFTAGEQVERICAAALGSPVLYRIKGSYIALRRADASFIEVNV